MSSLLLQSQCLIRPFRQGRHQLRLRSLTVASSQTKQNSFPFRWHLRSSHKVSSSLTDCDDNSIQASPIECFNVPLSVSDVHLRDEELPFAYFFRETLDADALKCSLQRVLEHFPVIGGRIISPTFQAIHCNPHEDTIPLTFGEVDATIDEWLSEARGHSHVSGGGHPELLPLFDQLLGHAGKVDKHHDIEHVEDLSLSLPYDNLVKIRVTYFQCGGTAIGVNMLHALGDTASCVHFVQCWGREIQQLEYPRGVSNVRAEACVAGMMTEDLADLMGLTHQQQRVKNNTGGGFFGSATSFLHDWYLSSSVSSSSATIPTNDPLGQVPKTLLHVLPETTESRHEYTTLYFAPNVLDAMKEVGKASLVSADKMTGEPNSLSYLSTNDLVTAFGWLLKRTLSGNSSWNVSMVVNMRGRHGVQSFKDVDNPLPLASIGEIESESSIHGGMFGNGITNVVAMHPSTQESFDIWDVAGAARSIRTALNEGMLQLPERLFQSKTGKNSSSHVSTANSFATTSWGQFPLAEISFSANQKLVAFHGHPSHPLPHGQSTYASVIMRSLQDPSAISNATGATANYGVHYNLLLPSDMVETAKQKHEELCEAFLMAQTELKQEQQMLVLNETRLQSIGSEFTLNI